MPRIDRHRRDQDVLRLRDGGHPSRTTRRSYARPAASDPLRVVLAGGSGQLGTVLARALRGGGHDVVVLSRAPSSAPWRVVAWDARTVGPWAATIDGADVVINLAGRSVNCRYSPANRRDIMASRVDSTRAVGEAIKRATRPPRVWLQSSTATIYAHRYDAPNDEATGILGGHEPNVPDTWAFSIDVAQTWEGTALSYRSPATRLVLMRSAMVMSPDRDGIFDTLLGLVRRGLGGRAGNGRQYVSWVHDADFVRAVHWLIEHDSLDGPVNIASPNPLPYDAFMRALRDAADVRIGLPATRWMLEIGALFMRTETELVLKSRRVVPGRLLESGFTFEHPEWGEAARDLVARRSRASRHPGESRDPR